MLFDWLANLRPGKRIETHRHRRRYSRIRLHLQALEDRLCPSTFSLPTVGNPTIGPYDQGTHLHFALNVNSTEAQEASAAEGPEPEWISSSLGEKILTVSMFGEGAVDYTVKKNGETFKLHTSEGPGSDDTGTVTVSGDAEQIAFLPDPVDSPTIGKGAAQSVANAIPGQPLDPTQGIEVQVLDTHGKPVQGLPVTIALGNYFPNSSTTQKPMLTGMPAGGVQTDNRGIATFRGLSINVSGDNYTLQAALADGTKVYSDFFSVKNVLGFYDDELGVTSQPPGGDVSTPMSHFAVTVYGPDGMTVDTGAVGQNVTLMISTDVSQNPPAHLLSGGNRVMSISAPVDANGVADFNDVAIDQIGQGYTLDASLADGASITSNTFTIGNIVGFVPKVPDSLPGQTLPTFQVAVYKADGKTIDSSFNGNVTISIYNDASSGGATLSGPNGQSGQIVYTSAGGDVHNGVAAISGLSLDKPGSEYVLRAALDDGTTGVSNAFNVQHVLRFTTQPKSADVNADISPDVVVTVFGADGVTPDTTQPNVTLTILVNPPGNALLSGTSQVTVTAAANGQATFTGLSINAPGVGYILQANLDDGETQPSNSFNIGRIVKFEEQPRNGQPSGYVQFAAPGGVPKPSLQVEIFQPDGVTLDTNASDMVTLAIANDGSPNRDATLLGVQQEAAFQGVATFSNLSIDKSGFGYTLKAYIGGDANVNPDLSQFFNYADLLRFKQQPSNTQVGKPINPPIVVDVLQSDGATIDKNYSGDVTFAIAANPTGKGVLRGITTVAAVHGVARFVDLTIDTPGQGYELIVSTPDDGTADGFNPLYSNGFFNVGNGPFRGPVVLSRPQSQTACVGETVTFSASAAGNPDPAIQWQRSTDGGKIFTDIAGASSNFLTMTASFAENGFRYRAVFVANKISVTTAAATLTVDVPPVVTANPTDQAVNAGQTASFMAAATGTPTPKVQWQASTDAGNTFKNIPGATATTFSFVALANENGEQIRAVFSNHCSATTTAANLSVNFAPKVTAQPIAQTVMVGNAVTFTAMALGNPTPNVQWQVSNQGGAYSEITGATSRTYTFVPTLANRGEAFRAVFMNSLGTATSAEAALTVLAPPQVTPTGNPQSQTVNAGDKITFTTAAFGTPAPTVQWMMSPYGGSTFRNIPGATSTTLSMMATVALDGAQFKAVFTNAAGKATTTAATLIVFFAPIITGEPVGQKVPPGPVTFVAGAEANPGISMIQWQSAARGSNVFSDITGANSAKYSFNAQLIDDGTQFRALFTNDLGTTASRAATLNVGEAPAVATSPTDRTMNAGQRASFMAEASGTNLKVQWQVSSDGVNFTNLPGATSTTLAFSARPAQNGSLYRAIFRNAFGQAISNAARLTVDFAPIITVQPATQVIAPGQVTFTAVAEANPGVTLIQWQSAAKDSSSFSNIRGANSTSYSFDAQLTDSGNRFRVLFTNTLGTTISHAAALTVDTPLSITTQPVMQTVDASQQVTFIADAAGTAGSVQWQVSFDSGNTFTNIPGATSTRLTFHAAAAQSGRQYRAVFTNPLGQLATSAAALSVNFAPVIINQPGSQSVSAGATVTFSTLATGFPGPPVQWQVSTDGGVSFNDIPGANADTLSFTARASDNDKMFRARFSYSEGQVFSHAVKLIVS